MESSQKNVSQLRRLMVSHFDTAELRTICFDLNIDYEDLPGTTKEDKARELVAYLVRRNRVNELLVELKALRPYIDDIPQIPQGPNLQKNYQISLDYNLVRLRKILASITKSEIANPIVVGLIFMLVSIAASVLGNKLYDVSVYILLKIIGSTTNENLEIILAILVVTVITMALLIILLLFVGSVNERLLKGRESLEMQVRTKEKAFFDVIEHDVSDILK